MGFIFNLLAGLVLAGLLAACGGGDSAPTTTPESAAITSQPADQAVVAGTAASFTVAASGATGWQWQRSTDGGASFSAVSGATAASYTTPATTMADSGTQYRVVVTGASNSVTSAAALLTVSAAQTLPVFTTQPASVAVTAPDGATFTAAATGNPSPTLQWQRSTDGGVSFVDLSGANGASLVISPTAEGDSGRVYRVVASNTAGSMASNPATLTVTRAPQAPAITAQPTSQTVTAGSTATFTAQSSGTPTPTWQWQLSSDGGASFANINGATSAIYVTPATTAAHNGRRFRAIATNVAGSATSAVALLTVTAPANRMAFARIEHTATLLASGKVLVAAGVVDGSSGGFYSSAETFDPASAVWSTVASLAQARGVHTATRLSDGRVLVVGGLGVNPAGGAAIRLATAELYDPVSNTWTSVGSLSTARSDHAATLLADGRVLVTGGIGNDANQTVASAELFDPATMAWSPAATPAQLRSRHQSVRLADGRVMLIGGGHQGSIAATELYDPATNAWSPGASMAVPRNHSSATVLANGKVLAVGGWDQLGIGVVGTAELYDPVSNTWSAAGQLVTGRYGHEAVLLGDGRVLIAAGIGATVLASAEIYDPAGNAWSATGALATARYRPVAASLANGKVLVTGGSTATGASLASGEVYDPLTGTWE